MRIVAIDPSVNNVGWAIFDSEKKSKDGRAAWSWGKWSLEGDNYQMRLVDIVDRMSEVIGELHILITEWPMFFSSQAGQVAAHNNYTINLAGMCGYIAGRYNLNHRQWITVTANTWKGTVSKGVTARKFFRYFKRDTNRFSDHEIDAVMILHWWLKLYGPVTFQNEGEEWIDNPLLHDQ